MSTNDPLPLSIIGIVIGVALFFRGFLLLWRKRLIENTPRSKVRSLAVGISEVSGQCSLKPPLIAPFARVPCVYFHSIQERLHTGPKGERHWIKEFEYRSDVPFFLKDDTGAVLVDPIRAETDIPLRYNRVEGDTRYRENFLINDELIYVLGTVRPVETLFDREREETEKRTRELAQDDARRAALDVNKDNWIDEQEWGVARDRIREEVRKEFEKDRPRGTQTDDSSHLNNLILGRGDSGNTFLVSTRDEKALVGSLGWQSAFLIWGGGAVFLGAFWLLVSALQNRM